MLNPVLGPWDSIQVVCFLLQLSDVSARCFIDYPASLITAMIAIGFVCVFSFVEQNLNTRTTNVNYDTRRSVAKYIF